MIEKILTQSKHEISSLPAIPKDFINRHIVENNVENIVLIGPRRQGKSMYLKYLYTKNKSRALYINVQSAFFINIDFKSRGSMFQTFVDALLEILRSGKYKLILLDEIQELSNWSNFLKSLIDTFSATTFIATGSDAITLKFGEAGTGRFKIKFIGFLTYDEFTKMHPNKSFNEYVERHTFPGIGQITKEEQYQLVYEKQFYQTRFKLITLHKVLESIALNPGGKLNRNTLLKQIKAHSDARPDSTQLAKIIGFLTDCEILYSINDMQTNLRARKETIYTLYPSNWLLFSYFIASNYNDLSGSSLPRKGFVFENMIISNIMAIFNTPLLRNFVRNKINDPDADLVIGYQIYEIKSYNVFNSDLRQQIFEKALRLNAIIVHSGPSQYHVLNEFQKVKLVNVKDFLLGLRKSKQQFLSQTKL